MGGLVIFLGGLVFDLILNLIFPIFNPMIHKSFAYQIMFVQDQNGHIHQAHLYNWAINDVYAGIKLALLDDALWGLQGMGWASLGLAVSSLLPNRYITLASPFIIGYIFTYAISMLGIHIINPSEYYLPHYISIYPPGVVLLLLIIPIITFFAIYYLMARRRLNNA